MDGFLLVDKPCGPSSFAVVNTVRRTLLCGKAGHSGTLDPQASGLLVVAVGAATRLLPYLPGEPKRYGFGMQFGTQTDTLDKEGKVTSENGRIPSAVEVAASCEQFLGKQLQTPPKYSAVKTDGKRAYERARNNEEFDLKEKTVTIFSLSLVSYDAALGIAECDMTCTAGTYVRALVRDIAQSLGTVAYAAFIRRLAIGPFSVEGALAFDRIGPGMEKPKVMPVATALASVPSVVVDQGKCDLLSHGKDIELSSAAGETAIAYTETGGVAAVLKRNENGMFHPEKVFIKG